MGSKQVEQGKAPSPSSYRVQHDNINHHKSPAFTFGVSREAFDKVYLEGNKGSADPTVPGPGKYAVEDYRSVGTHGSNKYSMRTKGAFQGNTQNSHARLLPDGPKEGNTWSRVLPAPTRAELYRSILLFKIPVIK